MFTYIYRFLVFLLTFGLAIGCVQIKKIKIPEIITKKPENKEVIIVEKPALVQIGASKLDKEKFLDQIKQMSELDSSSTDEILNTYLIRKKLSLEAVSRGMDTTDLFEEELEAIKQLFINQKSSDANELVKLQEEAFQFYQYEINASHIFIPLSPAASAADTLKVYNDLKSLKIYALKNKNFNLLAKDWSKDTKTNQKGGELGWFSVFHLVYPLEKIAFKTPLDSISNPVRTKSGYHIIKINGKRKNSGYVKVKHIFKYLKPGLKINEYDREIFKIDSLKNTLKTETDFNNAVLRYSDDINSKSSYGELPIFGIGTREESVFEEMAFSLNKGQISTPVKSSSGLHIIKLIDKYNAYGKSEFLNKFASKLKTDSRAEYLKELRIKKIKAKYNFILKKDILEECLNYADENILNRTWRKTGRELDNFVLFSIGNKNILVNKFFDYVQERQVFEKFKTTDKPENIFRMLFLKFSDKTLLDFDTDQLFKSNPESINYLEKQKEDLLITRLLQVNVYDKSVRDTLGQKQFFKNNPDLFKPAEIGTFSTLTFSDKDIYNKFKSFRSKGMPYQLNRGIKPLYFYKNAYSLTTDDKRKLEGLVLILKKNKGFLVEIGGHHDANEEEYVSSNRMKAVIDYLVKSGIPLTKIMEMNYKSSKIIDRFDWTQNQRVTFQFFSNFESDLVKTFNEKGANKIILKSYVINKQDFEKKMGLKWENQKGTVENNGKPEEFSLSIKKTNRTFKEAKYDVINKYQLYLKNQLYASVDKKFKSEYSKQELSKEIEKLKK